MRTILAVSLVLSVVAAMMLFERQRRDEQRAAMARARADIDALERRLAQVQPPPRMMAERARPLAPPPNMPMPPPPPSLHSDEADALDQAGGPSDPDEAGGPSAARYQAEIDRAFTAAAGDSAWARDVGQVAAERVAGNVGYGDQLLGLDCRDTMCRIRTTHADATAYHRFVQASFLTAATEIWNAGAFSTIERSDGDDGVVAVSYLAREGQFLPHIADLD